MELTFLQMLILYCLQKLKGERTIYSIFHLLHGKKSSQTIQDAYLFQLTPLFNTFPHLSRQELEHLVSDLFTNKWIQATTSNQHYIVTNEREKELSHLLQERPIPSYLNGMKYQSQSVLFWERLSLLIQVISYLQQRDSKYIPIQKRPETLLAVRTFIQQNKNNRKSLGNRLYSELVSCLDEEPEIDPNLFVIRLSGYRSIGLTLEQAAQKFDLEITQYYYEFLNVLHYMVGKIENKPKEFPILSTLLEPKQSELLTHSTEKTYSLLNQGYSISDIMAFRQLKRGTIEDHIVELALKIKDFSIDPYVNTDKQNEIIKVTKKSNTKQLRFILNQVEDVTYFEIRLVLAKYGDQLSC